MKRAINLHKIKFSLGLNIVRNLSDNARTHLTNKYNKGLVIFWSNVTYIKPNAEQSIWSDEGTR